MCWRRVSRSKWIIFLYFIAVLGSLYVVYCTTSTLIFHRIVTCVYVHVVPLMLDLFGDQRQSRLCYVYSIWNLSILLLNIAGIFRFSGTPVVGKLL